MGNENHIYTLKEFHETRLKEKNSTFIVQSFPIEIEEDFQNIMAEVKKKFYDANHHCYAYRLQNSNFKYSDDGEPNGTAGIRILNAIDHFELTNVLVVVIRYFGGTKLGVGLLGKTYYESAVQNLNETQIIKKSSYQKIKVKVGFEFISSIHRNLSAIDAKIESTNYDTQAEFNFFMKSPEVEELKKQLINITHGKIVFEVDKQHVFL